jgi:hypothetical protein
MGIWRGGFTQFLVLPDDYCRRGWRTKGNIAMTHIIEQTEEELLSFQVSDEALEAAAGSVKENAGAFTLAFCSGLDTCPA